MIIRITQHKGKMLTKDHSVYVETDEHHWEQHLVTTVWFLFIPIFKFKKLL